MAFRGVLDVGRLSSAFLQVVNGQLWQAGKKLLLYKCSSISVSNKKNAFLKGARIKYAFSLKKKSRGQMHWAGLYFFRVTEKWVSWTTFFRFAAFDLLMLFPVLRSFRRNVLPLHVWTGDVPYSGWVCSLALAWCGSMINNRGATHRVNRFSLLLIPMPFVPPLLLALEGANALDFECVNTMGWVYK